MKEITIKLYLSHVGIFLPEVQGSTETREGEKLEKNS